MPWLHCMLLCKVCWSIPHVDLIHVSWVYQWFANIVLAQCVNFLLLVCFLQEQDWLCTHTTSIVLRQTAYRRHLFARALSLKRAQASYTRPNYIALGHTTLVAILCKVCWSIPQSNAVALSMWSPQAAGIVKQKQWMQPCTRGMIDLSPRQKATVNQDKANMNASTFQPF